MGVLRGVFKRVCQRGGSRGCVSGKGRVKTVCWRTGLGGYIRCRSSYREGVSKTSVLSHTRSLFSQGVGERAEGEEGVGLVVNHGFQR